MLVEVDVEVGFLGGSLLGSQQREALTERCGGVGVLTWGQVVQQHGPQDLKRDSQVVQHATQHLPQMYSNITRLSLPGAIEPIE